MTQKNNKKVLDVKGTIGVKTKWAITPKQKAEELVEKFIPHIAGADRYNTTLGIYDKSIAKNCAIIAVKEILNVIEGDMNYQGAYEYFTDVETELENYNA